jgi:hypothetical protein
MAGACSIYGERRGAYRILEGRPEGRRPLGSLRHRWEDNIKIDLQEVGWGDMDWCAVFGEAWTGVFCLKIGTGGGRL